VIAMAFSPFLPAAGLAQTFSTSNFTDFPRPVTISFAQSKVRNLQEHDSSFNINLHITEG